MVALSELISRARVERNVGNIPAVVSPAVGSLQVSRQLAEAVREAPGVGINPYPRLVKAGKEAAEGGRKKVGLFGDAKTTASGITESVRARKSGAIVRR